MKKILRMILAIVMLLSVGLATGYAQSYTAGTYTATAKGNNGPVNVEVVFSAEKIESIQVKDHAETPGICETPIERIPSQVVEYQSLAVDVVTSATNTSKALLAAIEDCVKQAGGDAEALKAVEIESVQGEDAVYDVEVCVVGGGGAGVVAALKFAEKGVNTLLLEKSSVLGGEAIRSGGIIFSAGSKVQAERGLPEKHNTANDLKEYWFTQNPDSDGKMLDIIFGASGPLVDWMAENGVQWLPELTMQCNDWCDRSLVAPNEGSGMMKPLADSLEKYDNITVLKETPANKLLTDENGKVVGVQAKSVNGSNVTVHCDYVVLCTGGYDQSPKWVEYFHPEIKDYADVNGNNCLTGDGLDMAQEIGAALDTAGYVGGYIDPLMFLLVNDNGERFHREDDYPMNMVDSLKKNNNGTLNAYMVISEKNLQDIQMDMFMAGYMVPLREVVENGFEEDHRYGGLPNAGKTYKADTIEECAEYFGIPAENLKKTIAAYNEFCEAGVDAQFGKDPQYLHPIKEEEGPIYIYKDGLVFSQIEGGVAVDYNLRALREDGSVIEGLYCAGNVSCAKLFRANTYPGCGTGNCYALTGGYICADQILAQLDK